MKNFLAAFLFVHTVCLAVLIEKDYLISVNPDSLRHKNIKAYRSEFPPIINGNIDLGEWANCSPNSEFFQIDPLELSLPSEKTTARVMYDDKNLYVFLEAFDSKPKLIKKTLARRDSWMDGFGNNSDWMGVTIDSRNDDYNGYFCGVNASGTIIDVALAGDNEYDRTWDAVWDVAVAFSDQGWTAEFKFPFSMFQFDNTENMVWGISFERKIHRLQETVNWPGKEKSVRGIMLPLGVLNGLSNIPNASQLELVPYFLTGGKENIDTEIGLDARYGITSNAIMKVTLNPDFGQVEADPSVLNLTAYEIFYDEKRPFFSEGSDFFSQRINLFNSRRIGKRPSFFTPNEGELTGLSNYTTIIAATKIMGSTASNINYGIINAITKEESAFLNDSISAKKIIVEPRTIYSIGRFELPFFNAISKIGIMGTNVFRKDTVGANVIGGDWKLNLLDNRLFSSGQIIGSNVNNSSGRAFRFNVGYLDPDWWSARIWLGSFDNKFDINDLGFIRRNDITWGGARLEFRKQEPWGHFINNNIEFKYTQNWNGSGLILDREVEFEQSNLFSNYWRVGFFGNLFLTGFNDEDVFRSDNAWVYKTELWGYGGPSISTDRRKKIILGAEIGSGYGRKRGSGYRTNIWLQAKPVEKLNFELSFMQDKSPSYMRWVDIIENVYDTARVYANSILITKDVNIRIDWTFSSKLTFQCYAQPFYADLDYRSFFRLKKPETMDIEPYDYLGISGNENPDFRLFNTVGTFVLRWEYLPGSTLYLVYNLNQRSDYNFSDKIWNLEKENAAYFKINYWLKF
ncbi:MAG: hypothetical protein CMF94_02880 [Candidatus Marinimicrobia bacterium]|nr:hypothetical protein [Candidatus Neomarinimicrobiota bacterium]